MQVASLVAQRLKHMPAMWVTGVRSLGQEDPGRRKWKPTPVFLPGESHGRRSLGGYSPRGRKESDTTVQLHFQKRNKLLQEAVVSVRKDAHEAGDRQ